MLHASFIIVKPLLIYSRIFKLMDTEPSIPTEGGLWPDKCVGRIAFSNIDFTYPTRPDMKILDNFNLAVAPNQTVALVGQSGSGKNTAQS